MIGNDRQDPTSAYLNDGAGGFEDAGPVGEPQWPTRNAVLADGNGDGGRSFRREAFGDRDGFSDIAGARSNAPSEVYFSRPVR